MIIPDSMKTIKSEFKEPVPLWRTPKYMHLVYELRKEEQKKIKEEEEQKKIKEEQKKQ